MTSCLEFKYDPELDLIILQIRGTSHNSKHNYNIPLEKAIKIHESLKSAIGEKMEHDWHD